MSINLVVLVTAIACCSALPSPHYLTDDYIDHLNSQNLPWKAGRNFEKNTSFSYIKGLLGAIVRENGFLLETVFHEDNGGDLPQEFDSRKQWPRCESIGEIRDQSGCGSCWAVSSAAAMSDRVCIHSKQQNQLRISGSDLLGCCHSCGFGCNGGYVDAAWHYWRETGIVSGGEYNTSIGCKTYPLPRCDHHVDGSKMPCKDSYPTPSCLKQCDKGSELQYSQDLHTGRSSYKVSPGERQIQLEIMKNGPVVATFKVYDDFISYKGGVYQASISSNFMGYHAVRVIGWGVQQKKYPYWLVTNSWNENWGDGGLFKIMRGKNECNFESGIYAGLPK